jgi:hypothetical protein
MPALQIDYRLRREGGEGGDSGAVAVRRAVGTGRAWLKLDGSILILFERRWASARASYTPVEWLTVERGRRADGRHLGYALLSLLAPWLLLWPWTHLDHRLPAARDALAAAGCSLVAAAFATFLVFLVAYLQKRPTIRVRAPGGDLDLEFWHAPGDDARIDRLLGGLQAAQRQVGGDLVFPSRSSYRSTETRPLRVLGLALAASALPAVITGRPVWLALAAVPLLLLAVRGLRRLGEPRGYREACRAWRRFDLAGAESALVGLLAAAPELVAPRLLLIDVYLEMSAFEKAFEACGELARVSSALAEQVQQSIWAVKRIHARRS